jgi:ABC-type dipeptide/oligopeptide/nickel transport system ATPase component
MIIGISGYSGSGKDTVGIIIQYLKASTKLPLKVVLKSPKHHEWWLEERSGWQIKKWAGKLKVIASMLTGIPTEKFENQEFKKSLLGPEWGTVSTNPLNSIEPFKDVQFNALMSVREFLQKLGTSALRDGLHENTWINALMADYVSESNWIITDTRFPNEAEAIKKAGGIIIRIERPGIDPVNLHTSETSLDNWDFDHVVVNDGSITDLTKKIKKVLKASKML